MMLTIICLLHCCTQVRLTHSFTNKDRQVLERARLYCQTHYPKSSCLIKLTSKEESIYTAICGKENN